VLASDGTMWSVGYNNNGNLGLNDITDRVYFSRINPTYFGNSPVVKFHHSKDQGGNNSSCFAITAAGNVYRWGYNGTYILGNGGTAYLQIPTLLSGYLDSGERPLNIDFGSSYNTSTAFIHTSFGQVYTAGYNAYSICSRGTSTSPITTFSKMMLNGSTILTNIKAIYTVGGGAGYGYSSIHCVTTTGGIYSAGYNANYELGNGTTNNTNAASGYVTQVLGPDGVTPITGIRRVIGDVGYNASTSSVFAIMDATGLLYGWGANSYYELSIGTNVAVHYAVLCTTFNSVIAGAQQIKRVVYGRSGDLCSLVVVYSDGRMLASGYNSYGQLGIGSETVTGGAWVIFSRRDIVDARFMCANNSTIHTLQVLCADGTVYCSGYQASYGQMGDATNTNRCTLSIVHF
jgi:alpha-tubulin suppressor-like RCC1 family protein